MKNLARAFAVFVVTIIMSAFSGSRVTSFAATGDPSFDHSPAHIVVAPSPHIANFRFVSAPEFPDNTKLCMRAKALQNDLSWFIVPEISFHIPFAMLSGSNVYYPLPQQWIIAALHNSSQHRGPPAFFLV